MKPAPFHVVRTDLPRAECAGLFSDAGIAASTLDYLRLHFPEHKWAIVCAAGIVDDTTIRRKPLSPTGSYQAAAPILHQFKLLRAA